MDYTFTLVIKNIESTGGVVEQLLAMFDISYISIEADSGLVTPYEEYQPEAEYELVDDDSCFYDEDGNYEGQYDLDAAEEAEMDSWYVDDDGNWQYGPASEIDDEHSAFVGVPKDDETIIPRSVALEIARSLEEDEEETPVKVSADIYKEQILGISKTANFIYRFNNIAEAASKTLTRGADIARVLRGDRKSANGWLWKLASEPTTASFEGTTGGGKVLPSSDAHQQHGTIYGGHPHGTKDA